MQNSLKDPNKAHPSPHYPKLEPWAVLISRKRHFRGHLASLRRLLSLLATAKQREESHHGDGWEEPSQIFQIQRDLGDTFLFQLQPWMEVVPPILLEKNVPLQTEIVIICETLFCFLNRTVSVWRWEMSTRRHVCATFPLGKRKLFLYFLVPFHKKAFRISRWLLKHDHLMTGN